MKINDLEKLTGLKRSNIFYYEREGLIVPRREDNNYREYSEDDLRRLKAIVVFRKLGFTVAEIKELLDGERELIDVLPENMARLRDKTEELAGAVELCRDMERQNVTMETFDPDEWFETIESREREGRRFLDMLGDVADDVTRTLAFVRESVGFQGPVYANIFFSEEGIRKRRLWKLYWGMILAGYLILLAETYLIPGRYMRLASPWAALVYILVEGVIGSLVLVLCARYIIPGRKPRQALWLTIALVVGVNLCLGFLGRQAMRVEIDEAAQITWMETTRQGGYTGDDPLGYVQSAYNEKNHSGAGELALFETDGLRIVLASWGGSFYFREAADGAWTEYNIPGPVNGTLYTADPYGPEPYPSRLMLSDGTVVEPVYEARFDTGYVPIFAFDVGRSCRGILYGVDENGGLHYELRTKYAIAPEKTLGAYYNQKNWFTQFSEAELLGTKTGPAFLAAWEDWRGALWGTEPTYVTDSADMSVSSEYVVWVDYIAPPSLVIRSGGVLPDDWGLMDFREILTDWHDEGLTYQWKYGMAGDVTALLRTDGVTEEMLRAAAASVVGLEEIEPLEGLVTNFQPYSGTRTWNNVTVPQILPALWQQTRREMEETK